MRRLLVCLVLAICAALVALGIIVYPNSVQPSTFDHPEQAALPYASEWNYRQSLNACGPYSAAAVIRLANNGDLSSEEIAEHTPWRYKGYTLPFGVVSNLKRSGLTVQESIIALQNPEKLSWLREQIGRGSPVIILIRKNGLLHYVTLVGYTRQTFDIYDSLEAKGKDKLTVDLNGEAPGNVSWTDEELLTLWNQGGLFGLYQNYAITVKGIPPLHNANQVLTAADFDGFSVKDRNLRQSQENTLRIQIHPNEPVYTFHIVSTSSNGYIDVFREPKQETAAQRIQLDPNRWLVEDTPLFFNAADINFDGYLDIGTVVDGGALWGAFEYWAFDPSTKQFVSTPLTKAFREVQFNGIVFDITRKQIITQSLLGASGNAENVYQVRNGTLFLERGYSQENTLVDRVDQLDITSSTIHCFVTIQHRVHNKIQTTKQTFNRTCEPIPDNY